MKQKTQNRIAFILCGILAVPLYGQKTYTLEQCRAMALSCNIKIRQAHTGVHTAEQTRKEAYTAYFPTVSATGAAYNANKGLVQMELAPGMRMSMLKNGIIGSIIATQPVFAGGQIVNSNRLARVGVDVSRLQQWLSENEVSLTVEQYYWQVVTLQEKRKTLTTVEKMLEHLRRDVSTAVDAGITTRNDLLQVELKQNEIAGDKIKLENGLALSKTILAQYIGAEGEGFGVTAGNGFAVASEILIGEVPLFPVQLRKDHQASLKQTPAYNLLEKNVEAQALQKKLTVGKYLPTVAVGAGYMYDNLMDKSHPFGIAFATVSIPITQWWGGSHAVKKQSAQLKYAEYERTNSGELLVIKMQKVWNDVEDAYKQILIADKSIRQATENLRLNQDYYKAGTTTLSDLLTAQSLFQQSSDKYTDAYALYQVKKLEYLQVTGQ
ncbi:MAG: TolC family protein [Bacteroidaceae bacterium]